MCPRKSWASFLTNFQAKWLLIGRCSCPMICLLDGAFIPMTNFPVHLSLVMKSSWLFHYTKITRGKSNQTAPIFISFPKVCRQPMVWTVQRHTDRGVSEVWHRCGRPGSEMLKDLWQEYVCFIITSGNLDILGRVLCFESPLEHLEINSQPFGAHSCSAGISPYNSFITCAG